MKLSSFLLFVTVFNLFGSITYSQNTRLNLDMKDATIQTVLKAIEGQSEFFFLYSSKMIDVNKKVDINVSDRKITDVLDELIKGTEIKYAVRDKQILLFNKEADLAMILQQNRITGTITDKNGPIPGANVVVTGTTLGAITDSNGKFSIEVPQGSKSLTFSFVGMIPQEITIGTLTQINVTMVESAIGLDEVIVVGYGTQKKASLTGSVASTDEKMIKKSPAISLSNSLSGLLPGLTALNRSGEPGENISQIYIRGRGTTGNTSPLVVVDGVPDETGAWQRINQNDIQQISILKDASSSIYGARAANGVILITTKRGEIGKPTFNYTFNQGFITPTRLPEMANSWEFADYVNTYRETMQNLPALYTAAEIQKMKDGTDPVNYPNTNWISTIFKDVSTQSMHNLNVRGGTDKARYSMSGSYTHENSMVRNGIHSATDYALRSNVDVDITDNIRFGLDLNGGIDDRIVPAVGSFGFDSSPLIPAFFPNGLPASLPGDIGENPAINLAGKGGYESDKIFRTFLKPSFDIKIPWVNGLGIDGYFSYRNEFTENKRWRETWTVYNYDSVNDKYIEKIGGEVAKPDLREQFDKRKDYLINLKIKYKKAFGNHSLESFIAVEQAEGEYRSLEAYRKDFISPAIQELFAGSGENMTSNGTKTEWGRQNLFGRLNYNYLGKYLFETNLRYDGSYAFPKDKRWGFFPGVSVGWRLSQEKFLAGITFLDDLKLRASYGEMGNDQIDAFQYMSMYKLNPIGSHFGGGTQAVLTTGVAANERITWEVAKNSNIGFDATLWEGALGMTFDLFKQKRSNILTARTTEVPVYSGLILPDENVGIVENKGFEFSLTHRNKSTSQLTYSISGNFGYARNKIINISEPQDMKEYQKAEGSIIGAQLLYKALGIFRTQEEVDSNPVMIGTQVGDLQYEDVNKDGVINAADRVRIDKGSIPEISFGLNTTLEYKGFNLYANFAGNARAWTYIHKNCRTTLNSVRELILNRYRPGSMDSKYPIVPQEDGVGEGEVSGMPSTFWLQNASFLRLKTLQIGYTLPKNFVSKAGLSSMMIFVNGTNLFTLTGLEWYDPEGEPESSEYSGIRYSTGEFYPQTKIYNLGVNITF